MLKRSGCGIPRSGRPMRNGRSSKPAWPTMPATAIRTVSGIGRAELSDYMGGFQQSFPGASFEILEVVEHHGRSLTRWALRSPEGAVAHLGGSFATHDAEGRLKDISGFFR